MTKNEADKIVDNQKSLAGEWERIAKLFRTRNALKTSRVWFSGMSARIGKHRLSALRQTKQAKALFDILKTVSRSDIKALRTFAAINQEQAVSAFKVTMIANISIPIGVLALIHQLSPDGLGPLILSIYAESDLGLVVLICSSLFAALGATVIAIYSLANMHQARDIRHLIDLFAAEQGIYFGLEDMEG